MISHARKAKLDALAPIRQAVMGGTIQGHFGVHLDNVTGQVDEVRLSLEDGGRLVITQQAVGGLKIALEA